MNQRAQIGVLIVALLVLGVLNYGYFFGSGDSTPAGLSASADDSEAIVIGSVRVPDVELRVDLLERERQSVRAGDVRNIFAYWQPPRPPRRPDPTPPPVEEVKPEEAPPPEIVVRIPPPPYRFFGLAEGETESDRRVFLTDGTEIFSAARGDTLQERYRIVQIGRENLELEDLQRGHRWVIPLEALSQ